MNVCLSFSLIIIVPNLEVSDTTGDAITTDGGINKKITNHKL
jgi:hypothetical protein